MGVTQIKVAKDGRVVGYDDETGALLVDGAVVAHPSAVWLIPPTHKTRVPAGYTHWVPPVVFTSAEAAALAAAIRRHGEAQAAAAQAAEDRLNAAIPGLDQLRAAAAAEERYAEEFDQMMEDEANDGVHPPARPRQSVEHLRALYPTAAAYLRAEAWSHASHDIKAAAGRRAMRRLKGGDSADSVLRDMEDSWAKYAMDHAWD